MFRMIILQSVARINHDWSIMTKCKRGLRAVIQLAALGAALLAANAWLKGVNGVDTVGTVFVVFILAHVITIPAAVLLVFLIWVFKD